MNVFAGPVSMIRMMIERVFSISLKKETQKFFTLDIYQVVLPVAERKDKLTGKEFWQSLCNYTKKMKKTEAAGSEILMQAIQDICK